MKKNITILFAILFATTNYGQSIDQGTIYFNLGNGYSPKLSYEDFRTNLFSNSNGLSFGSEWVTGITVDGDTEDVDGDKYWNDKNSNSNGNFNISGEFGFFVSDGLVAGLGVDFSTISFSEESTIYDYDSDGTNDDVISEFNSSSLLITPFAKYYIPLNNNALFFKTGFSFGSINSSFSEEINYSSIPDEDESEDYEPIRVRRFEVGTGLSLFLSDNFSLEPSINYSMNSLVQEIEVNNYNSTTGLSSTDEVDQKIKSNAFYLKVAASFFF